MSPPRESVLTRLQKIKQAFSYKGAVAHKKDYYFYEPRVLHKYLLAAFDELVTQNMYILRSDDWKVLTDTLADLMQNDKVKWEYADPKTYRILFQYLLEIILHHNNPKPDALIALLFERFDMPWNAPIINEDNKLSTCLYEYLTNQRHPAVFRSLEKLVRIPGLNWGAKTASDYVTDKTPLYLLLLNFENTHPAIKLLVQSTPLHLLPFLQPVGIKISSTSRKTISLEAIHAINPEINPFFRDVSREDHAHYLMVDLAERIQNPLLCKVFVDKISRTSKLYPMAMLRLLHMYINQVREHCVHKPEHSHGVRLAIKRNNASRREDLYRALEVALAMPQDKIFYSTLLATRYVDGKAGARPFPMENDDSYLDPGREDGPWLAILNTPPIFVRNYLDDIRSVRKSIKKIHLLEERLEELVLTSAQVRKK